MAIITTADYKNLAQDYSEATQQLSGITDNYFDAAYLVVQLNTFDPEIDLLIPFFNAYQTSIIAYRNAPQTIINAVKELQDHVIARGVSLGLGSGQTAGDRYVNVDEYYSDESAADVAGARDFTVATGTPLSAEFAVQSAQAGHSIDVLYHL